MSKSKSRRKPHPFGPAAEKVEKDIFSAERVKQRLQTALKKLTPNSSGGES